jgi:hypothetical protein
MGEMVNSIAFRSLAERLTHACTPKWRFGTQARLFLQL